jgi:hypothetical protein
MLHSDRFQTTFDIPIDPPELIEQYRKRIHDTYDDIVLRDKIEPEPPIRGPVGWAEIKIKPGFTPKKERSIVLHGERRLGMEGLVKEWLRDKKIEPAFGPWNSPGFPVQKKNGTWRGVIDFRQLNAATENDSHPLPRIEDILLRYGDRDLYSVVDLKDAFHQIPLAEESRQYTCMSTPLGTYQWRVMPQGIKNGPSTFHRIVEVVLEKVSDVATPYFDDILVGTKAIQGESVEELFRRHDEDLRRVLDSLKEHKLAGDKKKCDLFVREVEFCGHILGGGCRRPSPGKLAAVQKWQAPKTITALRGFLGVVNYYCSYVPDFAKSAASLMDKLRVGKDAGKKGSTLALSWNEEELQDFEELKAQLLRTVPLTTARPDEPFILRCDASDRAIGAVLEQVDIGIPSDIPLRERILTEPCTRPVAFLSRKLAPGPAKTWSVREKETYAIVCALFKWAKWIGVQPVLILTDHKSLESWATELLDTPSGPAGRRARWHELFSRFNLEVI